MPDWLTSKQVAEKFQVTPRTVSRWVRSGKLPGYRVGGHRRYRREDVEALAERIETEGDDGEEAHGT